MILGLMTAPEGSRAIKFDPLLSRAAYYHSSSSPLLSALRLASWRRSPQPFEGVLVYTPLGGLEFGHQPIKGAPAHPFRLLDILADPAIRAQTLTEPEGPIESTISRSRSL